MSVQPVQDPLYQVPYQELGYRIVSAYFRCPNDKLEELLIDTPFSLVANEVMIYTGYYPDALGLPNKTLNDYYSLGPYHESAVAIPVKYKDVQGKYFVYVYVDSYAALAAGREFSGFPKKDAKFTFDETPTRVHALTERNGARLIDMTWISADKKFEVSKAFSGYQLLMKVIPKATGPGALIRKVVVRPSVFKPIFSLPGDISILLGGSTVDRLYRLSPTELIGGYYEVGDHPFVWAEREDDV